ncbi:MAG: hypothetical protein M1825_005834 [Sarcosagium campestre]|nr:MAG: hypothetical protein M1825_005834 [Sarcosagium campestre]
MAQSAKVGIIAAKLITSITRTSDSHDAAKHGVYKNKVAQQFKARSHITTDQFDVSDSLNGLDEKLRVYNRDDLADALRQRLDKLSTISSNFTPEILYLLLQLSDRPLEQINVDQDLAKLESIHSPPPLTWREILDDDPLDEEGVWDNIDYAAETSDEEGSLRSFGASVETDRTVESSVDPGEPEPVFQTRPLSVDVDGLGELEKSQFWRVRVPPPAKASGTRSIEGSKANEWVLTELQAIREINFMLSGLPTSLFHLENGGRVRIEEKYVLKHASRQIFRNVLASFVAMGQDLQEIRLWTSKKQVTTLMQTMRAAIQQRLGHLSEALVALQKSFISQLQEPTVVSLIAFNRTVHEETRALLRLAKLIRTAVETQPNGNQDFLYLELLFDYTCWTQMAGDDAVYVFMAKLFFECFQTYLKPIKTWMLEGELHDRDNSLFIARCKGTESSSSSLIWHDQYELRESGSGQLYAPKFLHAATTKILNTGKSIIFLKKLGRYNSKNSEKLNSMIPSLNFETLVQSSVSSLAPFSELFDSAFDEWLSSMYSTTSTTLRDHLSSKCGLWEAVDALEHVYFFKDGALASTFASAVFDKIDRGKEGWNDRFLLTELAQGVFGGLVCLDPDKLGVQQSTPTGRLDMQRRRRSVKILRGMTITYALPWPLLNIIPPTSLQTYQRVSTLLLQIRRATAVLARLRLQITYDPPPPPFFALRHRLLWLATTLYTHLTDTVLVPACAALHSALVDAAALDELVAAHRVHVARLEAQCLLAPALVPILQALISLLDLAILLADAHALHAGVGRPGGQLFDASNRSFSQLRLASSATGASRRRHRRNRLRRRRRDDDGDSDASSIGEDDTTSDEEDDDDDDDGQASEGDLDGPSSYISFADSPFESRLRHMLQQFDRLCSFACNGLRGVARSAGGDDGATWEILAERLEPGIVVQLPLS